MTVTDKHSGITATSNGSAVGDRFLAALAEAGVEVEHAKGAWVEDLARRGVGLAHPDDGWVDRERSTVFFAYPSMWRTSPAPGVRVALGWPDRWRLVELTHEVPQVLGAPRWAFVEVPRGD